MKSLAIVLSSVLVAAGLLLVSPAAASPEPGDLTVVPQNPPHSGGGGTPAGSAAPRGGGSTGESSGATSSPSGGSATASSGGGTSSSGAGGSYAGSPRYRGSSESARGAARSGAVGQAVPRESRPRGDRPITGTAVPRSEVRPPDGGGGYYPIYPSYPGYYPGSGYPYYGYGYWGDYWGFGLGSFYYDPFWWGFSPWYGGYGGYGYGYGGGHDYRQSDQLTGEIKVKVKPKEAEVYVDGYFVGIVDDFDGAFQHLTVRSGQPHRIEIRRPGFETLGFEVNVEPGQTVSYRGEMEKAPK
jgi:hypothetical protein